MSDEIEHLDFDPVDDYTSTELIERGANLVLERIIDDEIISHLLHIIACRDLNLPYGTDVGGEDLPEDDPRYDRYYRTQSEALAVLFGRAISKNRHFK